MKKVSLFLIGISVLLFSSCTTEEIVTKKENSSIKKYDKEQYSEDVDPATVKPPTHG